MKPRFFRFSYLVWLIVPLALYGGYSAYGLPHLRWSYSWVDEGQGYAPFGERHYTRCMYLGPYGAIATRPTDGRCALARFFKANREAS